MKVMTNFPAVRTTSRILGRAVLFPVVTAMLLLEPIVNAVCGCMMIGGAIVSVTFEISAAGSRFPFLQMLGLSLGFGVFLLLYHMLLALLVRD